MKIWIVVEINTYYGDSYVGLEVFTDKQQAIKHHNELIKQFATSADIVEKEV